MSSVNKFFTFKYQQPSEYHFSHDSVFLARNAFDYIKNNLAAFDQVLDLCAGCGVMGLDFFYHVHADNLKHPTLIEFLEIQDIYKPFFEQNVTTLKNIFKTKTDFNFLLNNYNQYETKLDLANKYDLILCNPPYFRLGQGQLSPSEFKNRCRFFIDSDFNSLIQSIRYFLKPNGKALVLIKSLTTHGVDIEEEMKISANGLTVQKIDTVRGTDLFELAKPLGF